MLYQKIKNNIGIIIVFLCIAVIPFLLGLYGLGWQKFFKPRVENINREVFEQTKSYVHGKIQDLAKYYDEYRNASIEDKAVLKQIIKNRFAEFDSTKINSQQLRNFLIKTRGY